MTQVDDAWLLITTVFSMQAIGMGAGGRLGNALLGGCHSHLQKVKCQFGPSPGQIPSLIHLVTPDIGTITVY